MAVESYFLDNIRVFCFYSSITNSFLLTPPIDGFVFIGYVSVVHMSCLVNKPLSSLLYDETCLLKL